ncbi:MAG TPA: phosphate ABC transporter substrate-binding protein PstS [Pirellulales bacterium]|jgi:phosphate transport system substrate-binding protein|nr:phosphate ABC transporter substrate-binding protein PstS [Pirellulales bacterium]
MATRTRTVAWTSILLLACSGTGCSTGGGSGGLKLQGAGASFPAPLYTKWFKAYSADHPDALVDYQSVGSGSGVKAMIDHTVDFGASDAAMTDEEIAQVPGGVQLLPMTAGSIVLAYNLPDIDNLKLSREAYAGIFLGKIKKWNDPAIAAANEDVKLPDTDVNVVVRADSSGTTFVFTKHLSTISKDFAASPGVNKMPNWPVGTKSKGNEGVSAAISTTPGAIGYVEYGYAIGAKLKMAKLENKAGKYIEPSIASGQASLASLEMPADLRAWLPDPEGEKSYPIVTYTWILAYKKMPEAAKAKALRAVLAYCLTDGQKKSESLGYIPLPDNVVTKVKAALENIQSDGPAAASAKPDDKTENKGA